MAIVPPSLPFRQRHRRVRSPQRITLGLREPRFVLAGTDAPHLMGEIQRALQSGDREALASSAHALKGSVGLFVQVGAFDTVRQLERTAKAGDSASTAAVYTSLEADMRALQNALNIFRQQLDS